MSCNLLRYFILSVALCVATQTLHAKKVSATATLASGEVQEVTITGYKNGLFSQYAKIRNSERKRLELSDLKSFILTEDKVEFVIIKTTVIDDEAYLIATQIMPGLYKTRASFRACTCKDGYRTTTAYVYETGSSKHVILKRIFSDKVIKIGGVYTGLTAELEKALKPLNYSFSSIPSLLSEGIN